MSEPDYFPALIGTVGTITTLDTPPKKRKHPIGFAPPKPKAKARTKRRTR